MKKKIINVFVVLFIIIALLPLAQEVNAATKSKKKTVYVPTTISTKSITGGYTNSYSYKIKYNKRGMPTKIVLPQGTDVIYLYGKNGFVKGTYNTFRSGGRTDTTFFSVNKKGLITKVYESYGTLTYKYGKKGRPSRFKGTGTTIKYDKYGNTKSYVYKDLPYINTRESYKLKLDKKGNVVREKKTSKYREGRKEVSITTVKYKYDKHGNIKQKIVTRKVNDGYTSTFTVNYKYKKVRVNKKYVPFLKFVKWKATHSLTGDLIGLEKI